MSAPTPNPLPSYAFSFSVFDLQDENAGRAPGVWTSIFDLGEVHGNNP